MKSNKACVRAMVLSYDASQHLCQFEDTELVFDDLFVLRGHCLTFLFHAECTRNVRSSLIYYTLPKMDIILQLSRDARCDNAQNCNASNI